VCGYEKPAKGSSKKQGAYGKVPTITQSKLSQLAHVDEVVLALAYKAGYGSGGSNVCAGTDADRLWCDAILPKVSRSFAAVIRQLPAALCMDVLIFYLVLRALDTVEDDMQAFAAPSDKVHCLRHFYETVLIGDAPALASHCPAVQRFLTADGMTGIGEGDEAVLLQQFSKVSRVFNALPETSKEVIADITRAMGAGMAEFVAKDLGQGTASVAEYNKYCHYVAGLVGHGLSRLFAATKVSIKCMFSISVSSITAIVFSKCYLSQYRRWCCCC
jgi:farnesyl-diphosphate farnesyltransferase